MRSTLGYKVTCFQSTLTLFFFLEGDQRPSRFIQFMNFHVIIGEGHKITVHSSLLFFMDIKLWQLTVQYRHLADRVSQTIISEKTVENIDQMAFLVICKEKLKNATYISTCLKFYQNLTDITGPQINFQYLLVNFKCIFKIYFIRHQFYPLLP